MSLLLFFFPPVRLWGASDRARCSNGDPGEYTGVEFAGFPIASGGAGFVEGLREVFGGFVRRPIAVPVFKRIVTPLIFGYLARSVGFGFSHDQSRPNHDRVGESGRASTDRR